MPKKLKIRKLSEPEEAALEKLRNSRTAAGRQVERARIVLGYAKGVKVSQLAKQVGRSETTIYNQLHRFVERGLEFVDDLPRPGRPEVYDEAVRGEIVSTAKTSPEHLGLSYGYWTLDRLQEFLSQGRAQAVSRTQLAHILRSEGIKWYQEKSYFSESPDPQFAEKRGRL